MLARTHFTMVVLPLVVLPLVVLWPRRVSGAAFYCSSPDRSVCDTISKLNGGIGCGPNRLREACEVADDKRCNQGVCVLDPTAKMVEYAAGDVGKDCPDGYEHIYEDAACREAGVAVGAAAPEAGYNSMGGDACGMCLSKSGCCSSPYITLDGWTNTTTCYKPVCQKVARTGDIQVCWNICNRERTNETYKAKIEKECNQSSLVGSKYCGPKDTYATQSYNETDLEDFMREFDSFQAKCPRAILQEDISTCVVASEGNDMLVSRAVNNRGLAWLVFIFTFLICRPLHGLM